MGSQPERTATADERRRAARERARRTLADMHATWTPEKWAELDQRIDAA